MAGAEITTLAERPHLVERIYDVKDAWPEVMGHDLVANALFNRVARSFPRFCVVGTAPDGTVVASGRSAPFAFGGPGRTDLLATGWDQVLG